MTLDDELPADVIEHLEVLRNRCGDCESQAALRALLPHLFRGAKVASAAQKGGNEKRGSTLNHDVALLRKFESLHTKARISEDQPSKHTIAWKLALENRKTQKSPKSVNGVIKAIKRAEQHTGRYPYSTVPAKVDSHCGNVAVSSEETRCPPA